MSWPHSGVSVGKNLGTILHIGAGTCSEIDAFRAMVPQQIVLVEPNPELLDILRCKAEPEENVVILGCAVSGDSESSTLNIMSVPALSSLSEPAKALFNLLPSLRLERKAEVDTQSAAELIDSLCLDNSLDHLLFIDTPGEASAVLKALINSEHLGVFSHIVFRSCRNDFYQDCEPAKSLLPALEGHGYHPVGDPDSADPDFPVYHLHFDKQFVWLQQLRDQLAKAGAQIESLCEQVEEKERALSDGVAAHDNEVQRLRAQVEEKERALSDGVAAHDNEVQRLRAQVEERERALSDEVQVHDLKIEQLQSEIDQASTDLSIALKLQMLRESDLADLQQRYKDTVDLKDRQARLLETLKERLSVAASYLRQLDADESTEEIMAVTAKLMSALEGSRDL